MNGPRQKQEPSTSAYNRKFNRFTTKYNQKDKNPSIQALQDVVTPILFEKKSGVSVMFLKFTSKENNGAPISPPIIA